MRTLPADVSPMASSVDRTAMSGIESDARLQRGARTRQAILQRAIDIASVEGLNGLTIGRVAADLQVSKSGLFAHFGSKEEFQLATVQAAAIVFADLVVIPAKRVDPGLGRVWAMCEAWLRYSRDRLLPGGCFFLQVSVEFDALPGPVRNAIAAARSAWMRQYEHAIDQAKELGEISSDTDSVQLAFELDALAIGANCAALLHENPSVYDRARRAIWNRLRSVATDSSTSGEPVPPLRRAARRPARPTAGSATARPTVGRRQGS